MKKLLFLTTILLVTIIAIKAQTLQLERHWWQPNSNTYLIYNDTFNQKVYLGGIFTGIRPTTTFGAMLNKNSLFANPNSARPNGEVFSAVSDGGKGWFIGGDFTMIGDSIRNKIAHIDSNGLATSLFSRNGLGDGRVNTLLLDSGILYAGGTFTYSELRKSYGIEVNYHTQNYNRYYPEPNGRVNTCISDSNGGWYIGGSFSKVGDSLRNNLAHIDVNGEVSGWNPNVNNLVNTLYMQGNYVFIGGAFTTLGGLTRNYIAAVSKTTGIPTIWNPNANSFVYAIAGKDSFIYVGGSFTTIGGVTRSCFAIFDNVYGIAKPFTGGAGGGSSTRVSGITVSGNTIYVFGDFTGFNSVSRSDLASIDATTYALTSWNPNPVGPAPFLIWTVTVANGMIYVGGSFYFMGTATRTNFAAFVESTGALSSYMPSIPVQPNAIAVKDSFLYMAVGPNILLANRYSGNVTNWGPQLEGGGVGTFCFFGDSNLYIAGEFTDYDGKTRERMAAFHIASGSLTSWNPKVSGEVFTIEKGNGSVYIGGSFTTVKGVGRNKVAELDITSAAVKSWAPSVNGQVRKIVVNDSLIYIAGSFSNVNSISRASLAAVNKNGVLKSWNPIVSNVIYDMVFKDSTCYIGGSFTSVGGQARNNIAGISLITGLTKSWNPNSNNTIIYDLELSDTLVYISGDFTTIGGQPRKYLAEVSTNTGMATNWNPNPNAGPVFCSRIKDNVMYVGGNFSCIGTALPKNGIVCLDANTGAPTDWNPNVTGSIGSIIVKNKMCYIGGNFTSAGGQPRNNLAAVSTETGLANGWNPNTNGGAGPLFLSDTMIYTAGSFTTIGSSSISGLARISINTGLVDTNWRPSLTPLPNIAQINVLGSTCYVGGFFSCQSRSNLAAISTLTGLVTSWNPAPDNSVYKFMISDSLMWVSGLFNNIGGQPRAKIAAIRLTNGAATAWNPGVNNGIIYSFTKVNNYLHVGGSFSTLAGVANQYLGVLNATSGAFVGGVLESALGNINSIVNNSEVL
ncbi:MAG: hypothetical protein V4590_05770, partial [Bacteroidota bacterium]